MAANDEKENWRRLFLIRKMNPRDLKPHPLNKYIYGVEEVDEDLVESIKEHGLLEKLVIKQDGTIISGHRRHKAILRLYPEHIKNVPCEIIGFPGDEDGQLEEEVKLLEYNRQRKKTKEQLAKEGQILEEIYSKQAEKRKLANLKQNQRSTSEGPNLVPRSGPQPSGKTVEKVADELGIGKESYRKLKIIREASESEDQTESKIAKELLQDENKSTHRSYEDLKEFKFIKQCAKDLNPIISEKAKAMLERIDSAEKVHGAYHALKATVDEQKALAEEYPSDDLINPGEYQEYIEDEEGIKNPSTIINPEKGPEFLKNIRSRETVPERQEPANEILEAAGELGKVIKEASEENKKIGDHPLYPGWQEFQKIENAYWDLQHALKRLECPVCGAGPENLKWVCCDITAKESVEKAKEKYKLTWREYREKYQPEEVVENAK